MPFQKRDIQELLLRVDTGEGDTTRQALYILLFLVTTVIAYLKNGFGLFKVYPAAIIIFMAWCFLSVSWAIDPNIAIRRVILSIVFIVVVANFVKTVGVEETLSVLYYAMAFSMIISIVAVFVIPGYARHPADEIDPALAGAWKGAFNHKNIAAMMAVTSFLFFFHDFLNGNRVRNIFLMLITLLFLVGTGGKSGLGLLAPALLTGSVYRYLYEKKNGLLIMTTAVFFFLALCVAGGLLLQDLLITTFQNPLSFTGRVAIWEAILKFVSDHPYTGSGFGSFWQVGTASPITKLTSQTWLLGILHSHNGYLEMLATTGIPGFLLAIIATVLVPATNMFQTSGREVRINSLLVSLLTFCVLINMMETQLFARDRQVWLLFLVVILSSRILRQRSPNRGKSQEITMPPLQSHSIVSTEA